MAVSELSYLGRRVRRAFVLGDVVVCPEEIGQTWTNTSDTEPIVATTTRAALWEELAATDAVLVGAHVPGLLFGIIRSPIERSRFEATGQLPRVGTSDSDL